MIYYNKNPRFGDFYFPNTKSSFFDISIIVFISSSSIVRCLFSLPQISHLCVIINRVPSGATDIGRIIPPHVAARSPGLLSTCRDHKHLGQWLVYPLP